MRYALIVAALLGMNLYAVEAVQDDVCAQGDCQQTTKATTTQVDEKSGLVTVADTTPKAAAPAPQSVACATVTPPPPAPQKEVLKPHRTIVISVVGQGVAPVNTTSPAQAYALAKRAAIADGYRQIAEKVKGVEVEGQDLIKNMMVKRSTVRTAVYAMVKNANVVETTFRDGLCEVEMEIRLSYEAFAQQ